MLRSYNMKHRRNNRESGFDRLQKLTTECERVISVYGFVGSRSHGRVQAEDGGASEKTCDEC